MGWSRSCCEPRSSRMQDKVRRPKQAACPGILAFHPWPRRLRSSDLRQSARRPPSPGSRQEPYAAPAQPAQSRGPGFTGGERTGRSGGAMASLLRPPRVGCEPLQVVQTNPILDPIDIRVIPLEHRVPNLRVGNLRPGPHLIVQARGFMLAYTHKLGKLHARRSWQLSG